jgi:hydroxymethylpyrimidine/phosphomethylpyrimidine kinase
MKGRVLIAAGSDSGGGAGIQADIKTVAALGGYAMTAITALTVQDTRGVHGVLPVQPDFIQAQLRVCLADLGADAIKTGMLGDAAVIDAVAEILAELRHIPVVIDPVMVAKGGASLLAEPAIERLRARLLPLADLLTPNLPEAETLCGMTIGNEAMMREAATILLGFGVPAVLLKGGHLPGDDLVDLLVTRDGATAFRSRRIATRHTHGTGCTLASAVATGLAQGLSLHDAVARARHYVRDAIAAAPGFGAGHGPLNHAVWNSRRSVP